MFNFTTFSLRKYLHQTISNQQVNIQKQHFIELICNWSLECIQLKQKQ